MNDFPLVYPDLTVKTLNILRGNGIIMYNDLIKHYRKLRYYKGIGQGRMDEINEFIKRQK